VESFQIIRVCLISVGEDIVGLERPGGVLCGKRLEVDRRGAVLQSDAVLGVIVNVAIGVIVSNIYNELMPALTS
jgi:hypothetical protein